MRNILKFIYQVQQVEPEITDALLIGILHLVMMTETSCEYLDCLLKQEGGLFFSFYYRAEAGSEHKAVSHRSRVDVGNDCQEVRCVRQVQEKSGSQRINQLCVKSEAPYITKIAQSSVNLSSLRNNVLLSSYNYDKQSTVNHLHVLDTYL